MSAEPTRLTRKEQWTMLKEPTCKTCGAAVAPGTLLTHERTHRVEVAAEPVRVRACKRVRCVEFYGPLGHVVGAEGPCAY